ncbi:aminotransferase class V-fold PLP-dependent enzyme [Arthrobacter bambusae]|uniref:Kynureninase n=1 Tax=Arthrobacter bambusae TaxID=1338426 RepID=A0AAW8DJ50_9MICC|nr:aminotransferase class V-fold PLP-dependent enzyme [Arthrobacter bambusae]MDP9906177.1 kynureninase [Arthrobacter bambusae]MDQ0130590.1 kynureninase [Arthrobacter bambusae]MDQ0182265.1 kynureninase [Arthrobacter bambusae]
MNAMKGITDAAVNVGDSVEVFRAQFPVLKRKVHLASNARGAMSMHVRDSYHAYLDSWANEGTAFTGWLDQQEAFRGAVALLIGSSTAEVAVTASVTAGLASLLSGINWQSEGRRVIVADDQNFPSVMYLLHAQARHGVEVRIVPAGNSEAAIAAFEAAIDDDCKLVCVSHVSFRNGRRLDLARLSAVAHRAGAWLVVDDYHCAGTRVVDVEADGVDVLTSGTAKFLLGSPGVAFLYVRDSLLADLHPTITGWFAQRDPNDMQIAEHREADDSRRFQVGSTPVPAIYGSRAGIEVIASVGLHRIQNRISTLTAQAIDAIESAGFVTDTPRDAEHRAGLVAIRADRPEEAVRELAARDILVTTRSGNIRTAWHYYNTEQDLAVLMNALEDIGGLLVPRHAL